MWSDSRFCLFSTDTICYNCSSMQLKLDLFQPVWTNCNSETFTFEFQLMKSLHFVRQTYLQMFYFLNHVFKVLVTANRKKIIKNIYLINSYMKKISHFNYKLSCYLLFNVQYLPPVFLFFFICLSTHKLTAYIHKHTNTPTSNHRQR